ncbi:LysE family translocator [Acuticoccus sp. M5D2P5]|uniref:LysE family translocator n=1 Tax=Acuticoccus kalidii TaxID=2910977 RepID=UPI001F15C001|nr:LysE family translocator [Acuticoccus kalidii]MCF3932769.1 LysE family translocator [Acuticoccus kalidii]
MSIETILLFAATEALLSLTPGPAVILVIGLAMRSASGPALAASAGVIATNAVYFALSALGVGALILASATLFGVLKWLGAAYLVFLGVGMLRPWLAAWRKGAEASPVETPIATRTDPRRAFRKGAFLQASNPKNLAFFVALLPQFVTPGPAVGTEFLILGLVSIAIELPILGLYALLASLSMRWLRAKTVMILEALGGGVLIGLGTALAAVRSR